MKYELVKRQLESLGNSTDDKTGLFAGLTHIVNKGHPEWEGRDLVIRFLDKFKLFDEVEQSLLLSLVRTVGLFPYITEHVDQVSAADRLAYEVHRVQGVEKGMVFHRLQAHVFHLLMQGRNVVLSASTSAGKSLVIDAVLAQGKFRKVVVIVPTIALIDETRRRLVRRFRESCNVITHPSQEAQASVTNVYLLTQERVLQRDDLDDVDFFVIDEFYKLDLASDSEEKNRSVDLSLAFHRLANLGAQFYLLGPHIHNIQGLDKYEYNFIPSNFSTVAVDVTHYNLRTRGDERKEKLLELCQQITTPTLIYCQSPASANRVAQFLIDEGDFPALEATREISAWIAENYHPAWNVAKAISLGIGIHHGGVPRAIQQYFVKLFNERSIRYIICTSTMIEGVNTSAENVIIYDRRINKNTFDFFTFKNISGRAGRMNQYFIGKVFMLEEPPEEKSLTVDYPIGLQDSASPMGLLMKLEPEYLTDQSKQRLEAAYATPQLSTSTLIENRHIPIDRQVEVADRILREKTLGRELLTWKGNPEQKQLEYLCTLIYDHLPHKLQEYGIHSGLQLAWHINALRAQKNFQAYLQQAIDEDISDRTPSESIGQRLKLIRNVISYRLPRDIMALSKIQADVFRRVNVEPGDFGFFAEQLENLFHDPLLTALDEYGVPVQISSKFKSAILPADGLTQLLDNLRAWAPKIASSPLSSFEKRIVKWAVEEI
ncbi:DEAD/DEAH box helicase [Pseudomonas viridiflava]|uniref:DEAD/DEAH box helicase n=1 Tax=Pseudomonas viridiflava TaxID=33069 RepID=UPI000F03B8D0|nr:DEAD/DEAH box helicase [Pseudomonas viridiflava]